MKDLLLSYFIRRLSDPVTSKVKYFWLRFWIETFQDKEKNWELIEQYARAVHLVYDAHLQYQLSTVINDYFVHKNQLYLIINPDDLKALGNDIIELCDKANISVNLIADHWTGQTEMYQHLIFNSLV